MVLSLETFERVYHILYEDVKNYDVPVVELMQVQTQNPYNVLVTTILSARTKDQTTTKAARKLFEAANSLKELKQLSEDTIRELIYPVGFYKQKAKYLKQLPNVINSEFSGKIPNTIEDLVKLPGVGRKTANLVKSVAFDEDAICVDVHVHRIMNRLGFVATKTPFETEMELRKKLPKRLWKSTNRILVAFGQNLCSPVSPRCSVCPINQYCEKNSVTTNR